MRYWQPRGSTPGRQLQLAIEGLRGRTGGHTFCPATARLRNWSFGILSTMPPIYPANSNPAVNDARPVNDAGAREVLYTSATDESAQATPKLSPDRKRAHGI